MHLMPATLPLTAVGLLLVAVALNVIAGAMKIFGSMSWAEIGERSCRNGRSFLVLLAIAAHAMSGIVGAVAIGTRVSRTHGTGCCSKDILQSKLGEISSRVWLVLQL